MTGEEGMQKGATPEMVAQLDANLAHYADCIEQALGKQVKELPGAGAAGGMGAAGLGYLADIHGIVWVYGFTSFLPLLGLATALLPKTRR